MAPSCSTRRFQNLSSHNIQVLKDMANAMQHAWALPRGGRDVATRVGDALRESGGLDVLVAKVEDSLCSTDLRVESAEVLERAMTADNRDHIVNAAKLKSVVRFSIGPRESKEDGNGRSRSTVTSFNYGY